jgi:YggT family protein
MGTLAPIGLLFDLATSLQRFVQVFVTIYIFLILTWVVLSWFQLPYSRTIAGVQEFLDQVCRPYLRLFRRLPPVGPFDLSPIVGILVLLFAAVIVNRVIGALL